MISKSIRAAFKRAKMLLRCTKNQLHDYVHRARKNLSESPAKAKDGLRAAELQAAAEPFQLDFEVWQQPLHRPTGFEEERVCAAGTCCGTREARGTKSSNWPLHDKQKFLANNYTVLTLSFLVLSSMQRARNTDTRQPRPR